MASGVIEAYAVGWLALKWGMKQVIMRVIDLHGSATRIDAV